MKFLVRLDGTGVVSGTLEIEANTKEEAEVIAGSRKADVVWHYNRLIAVSRVFALPKG